MKLHEVGNTTAKICSKIKNYLLCHEPSTAMEKILRERAEMCLICQFVFIPHFHVESSSKRISSIFIFHDGHIEKVNLKQQKLMRWRGNYAIKVILGNT